GMNDVTPGMEIHLVDHMKHEHMLNTLNWAFENTTPVALDDTGLAFTNGGPRPISVLGNDNDVDHDALTISAVGQPAHGTAGTVYDPFSGRDIVVYTPTANYAGPDQLSYTVTDGFGGFDSAQ